MRRTFTFVVSFLVSGCVGDSPVNTNDAGTDTGSGTDASDASPAKDVIVDAPAEAGPPFPATLSGVVVWLDAQLASSVAVTAGKVTKWTDRTNFQHDAIAVVGHEPTLGTDTAKGLPIIKFASADMTLAGAGTDPSLQYGTGDFFIAMVMLNTASGGIIFHNMPTPGGGAGINIAVISAETRVGFAQNYAGPFLYDSVSSLDGKLRLFGVQRTSGGTAEFIRDNGAQTATTTVAGNDVTTGSPFHVGAFGATTGGPQYMTGAIGEIVVVKGAITDPDRAALESYLMTKWQLP